MAVCCQWEQTSSSGSGILSCLWYQSRTWMSLLGWRRRMLWPRVCPRRLWGRSKRSELNWENILGWDYLGSARCWLLTNVTINLHPVMLCTDWYKWVDQALGAGGGQSRAHPWFSAKSTKWRHLGTSHYASVCAWTGRPRRPPSAVGHALSQPEWQFTARYRSTLTAVFLPQHP